MAAWNPWRWIITFRLAFPLLRASSDRRGLVVVQRVEQKFLLLLERAGLGREPGPLFLDAPEATLNVRAQRRVRFILAVLALAVRRVQLAHDLQDGHVILLSRLEEMQQGGRHAPRERHEVLSHLRRRFSASPNKLHDLIVALVQREAHRRQALAYKGGRRGVRKPGKY